MTGHRWGVAGRRLLSIAAAVCVGALSLTAGPASAAGSPGSLDPGFGVNGISRVDFPGGNEEAFALALQDDGRIVAVGSAHEDFGLARYGADGELDATFGSRGLVSTDFAGAGVNNIAKAVAIQPHDGKVIAAGCGRNCAGGGEFALARYAPNGALDATFGGDGFVTSPVGPNGEARALLPQGDTILAAGPGGGLLNGFGGVYNVDFTVFRYLPDGQLDLSFGPDGKGAVRTDFMAGNDLANAMAMQDDGKIVLAGRAENLNFDFGIVRYTADGVADPSFGSGGKVATDFSTWDEAVDVAVQDDGKIVAVGHVNNSSIALARYTPEGLPDPTFGNAGQVRTNVSTEAEFAGGLVVAPDGDIVVTGAAGWGTFLLRYQSNGTLDPEFGTGGVAVVDGPTSWLAGGRDLQLLPDGDLIVAAGPVGDFAVTRFNSDGTRDAAFGSGRWVTTDFGSGGFDVGVDGVLQDGKVVTLARLRDTGIGLARLTPEGGLDPTFGDGGKVVATTAGEPHAMTVQPDGKLVVVGQSPWQNNADFLVLRFNPDGTPDPTFGAGGVVTTPIGEETDTALAVAIQPDGAILVAGTALLPTPAAEDVTSYDVALIRYTPSGAVDQSFGTNGVVSASLGGYFDNANDIAIEGDGDIVLAGQAGSDGAGTQSQSFAILRYRPDGTPDSTFGSEGEVRTAFPNCNCASAARTVDIQRDGKLVVAGQLNNHVAIARYNPDGTLDNTFSSDGRTWLNNGDGTNPADVILQPDGRILLAGSSYTSVASGGLNTAVFRYLADGTIDTSFGTSGVSAVNVGGDDEAVALLMQADGLAITVGSTQPSWEVRDVAVARFFTGLIPDDGRPPETTIASGPSSPSGSSAPSFIFSSSEAGSSFSCRLDGSAFAGCTSPKSYTGLTDGPHTFEVRATDGYGDTDTTPATWSWTVDTTAPDTVTASGPPSVTNQANASFSFTSSESGSSFECRLDAGTFAACNSPKSYAGLSEGAHTFAVRAIDAAGNIDSSPATRSWTVDATPPAAPALVAPANGSSTMETRPVFDWSDVADVSGVTYHLQVDNSGSAFTSPEINQSGLTASAFTPTTNLSPGTHSWRVRAVDGAGNAAWSAVFTVTVLEPPGAIAGTVTSQAAKKALAGATVSCGSAGTATTAADGTYSIPSVAPGTYSCTASASGHKPLTKSVTVSSNNTATANFALRK